MMVNLNIMLVDSRQPVTTKCYFVLLPLTLVPVLIVMLNIESLSFFCSPAIKKPHEYSLMKDYLLGRCLWL